MVRTTQHTQTVAELWAALRHEFLLGHSLYFSSRLLAQQEIKQWVIV